MSEFQYSSKDLTGRLFRFIGLTVWLLSVPAQADVDLAIAFGGGRQGVRRGGTRGIAFLGAGRLGAAT